MDQPLVGPGAALTDRHVAALLSALRALHDDGATPEALRRAAGLLAPAIGCPALVVRLPARPGEPVEASPQGRTAALTPAEEQVLQHFSREAGRLLEEAPPPGAAQIARVHTGLALLDEQLRLVSLTDSAWHLLGLALRPGLDRLRLLLALVEEARRDPTACLGLACPGQAAAGQRLRAWVDGLPTGGSLVRLAREQLPRELPPLTAREREILDLVIRGYRDAELARELRIALPTAKVHVRRVCAKLGVAGRGELLARVAEVQRQASHPSG